MRVRLDNRPDFVWTAIHLGQFVGMAVLLCGLLVLFYALNVYAGASNWAARFAPILVGGGKRCLPAHVRLNLELLDKRHFGRGILDVRYRTKT